MKDAIAALLYSDSVTEVIEYFKNGEKANKQLLEQAINTAARFVNTDFTKEAQDKELCTIMAAAFRNCETMELGQTYRLAREQFEDLLKYRKYIDAAIESRDEIFSILGVRGLNNPPDA